MTFAQAAILIATFRVAGIGSGMPELGKGGSAHVARALEPEARQCMARPPEQPLPPEPYPPISLVLALAPTRNDADVPSVRNPSAIDEVRPEIRRRIAYFQSCAAAASRRGITDVRRLEVTWTIAADGSVKAMVLEGVMDPEMAACLARVGSRRFPVQPGTELTIPVAIVIVS